MFSYFEWRGLLRYYSAFRLSGTCIPEQSWRTCEEKRRVAGIASVEQNESASVAVPMKCLNILL